MGDTSLGPPRATPASPHHKSGSKGPQQPVSGGETQPCATNRAEERLPLTREQAGRQGSKERALTPYSWTRPPGVPGGGAVKESREESRKPGRKLRVKKSAAPSRCLCGFFIKGQDNCQHQTFISFLNIVLS